MNTIYIDNIPKVWFAHTFSAQKYNGIVDLMPNSIEITYLKKGTLTYYDKNNRHFELKEGTVFIGAFNTIKKVYTSSFHEHHTFSIIFSQGSPESDGFSFSYLPIIFDEIVCKNIAKYIDLLIMEFKISGANGLKTISYVYRILEMIDSYSTTADSKNELYGNTRYVNKAKKYIVENTDKKISIEDVAAAINVTPQYLCNIFKKVTGITVVTYINQLKLEKIKNLVINNGLTLRQASEIVGLCDESYTSRLIKKHYGKSISELKKYPDRMLKYNPK